MPYSSPSPKPCNASCIPSPKQYTSPTTTSHISRWEMSISPRRAFTFPVGKCPLPLAELSHFPLGNVHFPLAELSHFPLGNVLSPSPFMERGKGDEVKRPHRPYRRRLNLRFTFPQNARHSSGTTNRANTIAKTRPKHPPMASSIKMDTVPRGKSSARATHRPI